MKRHIFYIAIMALLAVTAQVTAQYSDTEPASESSLYDLPPRWLVDMPTAGTLPRAAYAITVRLFPEGGALGFTDIGLSNRLTMGISFGGDNIISNQDPNWNSAIEFGLKFRVVDELDYFPAVSIGFSSQGSGAWNSEFDRYTFKSRGFYGVASRSFYFYQWTAGWHAGVNYSLEYDVDGEKDINFFAGFDATFKYNLALLLELDAALNDDSSKLPNGDSYTFAGKGRGYLSMSIKWLFTENLEIELLAKDLLVNRRESESFTREVRLTYIDGF